MQNMGFVSLSADEVPSAMLAHCHLCNLVKVFVLHLLLWHSMDAHN